MAASAPVLSSELCRAVSRALTRATCGGSACASGPARKVQRYISGERGVAWPAARSLPAITPPTLVSGRPRWDVDRHGAELDAWLGAFPAPGAAARPDDGIDAWYGPPESPVLRLPSLPDRRGDRRPRSL